MYGSSAFDLGQKTNGIQSIIDYGCSLVGNGGPIPRGTGLYIREEIIVINVYPTGRWGKHLSILEVTSRSYQYTRV